MIDHRCIGRFPRSEGLDWESKIRPDLIVLHQCKIPQRCRHKPLQAALSRSQLCYLAPGR